MDINKKDLFSLVTFRASKIGFAHGLKNPHVIIFKSVLSFYIGIKFENFDSIFLLRHALGKLLNVFKFNCDADCDAIKKLDCLLAANKSNYVEYSNANVPEVIRTYAESVIDTALSNPAISITLFSPNFGEQLTIVEADETYETLKIEQDLEDVLR